jgi:antitoxin component YwqK of YwqJK toxin-antitoxin module
MESAKIAAFKEADRRHRESFSPSELGMFDHVERDCGDHHDLSKGDENIEGVRKYYYDDGELKGVVEYHDNKRNGPWITYYRNGQIRDQKYFVNDLKEGTWAFWGIHGYKETETNYFHGYRDGLSTHWYADGKKDYEEFYSDEGYTMVRTGFTEDGVKDFQSHFHVFKINDFVMDYVREGLFTQWYTIGNSVMEGDHQKMHFEQFKAMEGNYHNNKKVGVWTETDWDGTKTTTDYGTEET